MLNRSLAGVICLAVLFPAPALSGQDEVCAKCHAAIYRDYETTPMAQSSGIADAAHAPANAETQFTAAGVQVRILPRVPSAEIQVSQDGQTASHQLLYFIGAGVTGRSYVYAWNNYLFQSPVAWYSSIAQWGLSPGFENSARLNLIRPVEASCLNCHATGTHLVAGTRNRYDQSSFGAGGITCERCHGASEQHVARMSGKSKAGSGAQIINPAKLPPRERDSICAQCHLMGVARIAKAHAQPYAPGDVLFNSTSVFLWTEGDRPLPANSHFEQLIRSACWRKSEGKLWCGTCHDPHRVIPAAERAAWYRARCQSCHGQSAPQCAASIAARKRAADDCLACHMPAHESATVQHAAQTDHSIPRIPATRANPVGIPANAQLAPFPGSTAADRELGLAYAEQAITLNNRTLGLRALELLRPQFAANRADALAGDQLAQLLDKAGRQAESCEIYIAISSLNDAPPAALVNAGTCLASAANPNGAIALWKRALEKNAGEESARLNLAVALYRAGDAASARTTLQQGLALDPFWSRARELLAAMQ